MNVLILAAGEGTRLRPYTNDKPKCLVEINGNTLLSRNLSLFQSGQYELTIVGGYFADQLFGLGCKVVLNQAYASTNMVSSLFCAENLLSDGAVITYGDTAFSPKILERLSKAKGDICVAVDQNWLEYWSRRMSNPLNDLETLKLNASGDIVEIGERAQGYHQIDGQYVGLIKVTKSGANLLRQVYHQSKKGGLLNKKEVERAYITDLLQEVINQGGKVRAVPFWEHWIEIDSVDDLMACVNRQRVEQIDQELSQL